MHRIKKIEPNSFPFPAHNTTGLNLLNKTPSSTIINKIILQILIKSILFSDKNIFSPVCIFFTKNMIPVPKIYSIVVTKKKIVLASIMSKYPFLKNNGKSMNRFAQYIVVQIASRLNSFFSRVLSFMFTRNPLFVYFFAFKQYYIRILFNIPCIFLQFIYY